MTNKLILSSVIAVVAALSFPLQAMAQASGTFVQGFVYDSTNGNAPVSGASVFVKCNSTTIPATTNGAGKYSVTFNVSACPENATVTASASKDDLQGTGSDTVDNVTANINIAVVNVFATQVPEFGLLTGAAALLGSGGTFFAFRRRFTK